MAKQEPKDKEKPAPRKMGKKYKIMLILFCLVSMAFLRTGFIFIIIAMLPSVVAYYFDQSDHRYTFKSIFYCNTAGILPYLAQLIQYGPRSSNIQGIMDHPVTWMVVFGSATGGLLLTLLGPIIGEILITSLHQTQVRNLQRAQKRIEKEWGSEISRFGLDN
jgi:uncharacterized membrane protein